MTKSTWLVLFATMTVALLPACGDDDGGNNNRPDGGGIILPPDANTTMADAPPPAQSCNTAVQDCMSETDKCTVVVDPATDMLKAQCVPITGMKVEGETCQRMPDNNTTGVGKDDCDKGLFCSGRTFIVTGPPQMRVCRKLCKDDLTCTTAGQKCMSLGDNDGICLPTCTFFGTECGTGLTCDISTHFGDDALLGECRGVGPGPLGSECDRLDDCPADSVCARPDQNQPFTCRQLCDATHACPGSQMCGQFGGNNPSMIGFCI